MNTFAKNPYVRIAHKSMAYILVFCIVNMPVWALNWNNASNATFDGNLAGVDIAGDLDVTIDQLRAVINWNDINTIDGQTLSFNNGNLSAAHAVLNRVIGGDITQFDGILQGGQGHILLINPNGITIGGTAVINAGRFTASTMDLMMTDQQFLAENSDFEFAKGGADPSAQIALLAGSDITAERVDLMAQQINNAGTISTGPGGIVVMAAGESILLGQPGSKVIVEMTGIDGGSVTNSGTVTAPEGTIIMAAGDIYSAPLHPQLDPDAVRVETGSGTVAQEGTMDAGAGSVVLTAGDAVTLADGSSTSAVDGEVITYAYDFADPAATTTFEDGAEIEVGTGLASIGGNHISFAGDVIADPEATLNIYSQELTIVEGAMPADPPLDTLYEQMVESYSNQGINLDLAAEELITVEYMEDDGAITGGDGDIQLRNVFENGGILFEGALDERTKIETIAVEGGDPSNFGGHIYMIGGTGGIVAGDLETGKLSKDKASNPGIIAITTIEGGDIEVESMVTDGGNYSDIAAISGGNLTVHGEVLSKNHAVPKEAKDIGFARICLVAQEDIYVDAEDGNIEVYSHGKRVAQAEIIICAGENVTITNVNEIVSDAQTSENTPEIQIVYSSVGISAGGNMPGNMANKATISINGTTYDPAGDNSTLPISLETTVSGGGSPLRTDPSETPVEGDPGELTWGGVDDDPTNHEMTVTLRINNNEQVAPGHIDSPCYDCPVPPGIPPVPVIFWVVDDEFQTNWRSGNVPTFDPAELDVLDNDNGIKLEANIIPGSYTTDRGGTLELFDTGTYFILKYTPPTDQDFVWDGTSSDANGDYAFFIDTFTYQATKEVDGQTVYSKNTANVEIVVTNYLPELTPDSDTIHMNTSKDFDLGTLVVDQDGTPGTLDYGVVEGLIPVSNGSIATDSGVIPDTLTISGETVTYAPLDGYVSPGGAATTFGYSVSDTSIVNAQDQPVVQSEDLDVTVTNTLPYGFVVLENAPMDADGETLSAISGGFADAEDSFEMVTILRATDDDNKTFGGTLDYNGQKDPYASGGTYDYSADAALPGYVGEDNFDVQLWDGQKTYYADGSSEEVYGDGKIYANIVNDQPYGFVVLEDAPMDADGVTLNAISGGFADTNGDAFAITSIDPATDDYNKTFGGTLDYNGPKDPYSSGGTYDYTADPALPGYVGEDNFDVQLWDGEKDYAFIEVAGEWVVDTENTTNVYGAGKIYGNIVNELPKGNAYFGQVHMDSQGVTQDLEVDFDSSITVVADMYTGSVIGSDNYGGTLVFDGTTWTYSTDTGLPGYVGDDNDEFGQPGYIADDLFAVNVNSDLGQQYDYWFSDGPAPEGYTFYEPAELYRKAESGSATVSVDITNALPTIDEKVTIEHMDEIITDKLFATDHLDGNPINELDDLKTLDSFGDETSGYSSNFGIWVPVDNDNPDGTSTYTYTPADGYVGEDSVDVTVWDGQINYVFVNGEIDTEASTKETVSGTINLEYTNILPEGTGDLGSTPAGTTLTVGQPTPDTTSPVLVIDIPDLPQQNIDDELSIPNGSYTGSAGGTLVYDGTNWVYTPPAGFTGTETFKIDVWDGQYDYANIEERSPVYGQGTVSVTVTSTPPPSPQPTPVPVAPVAPLADYEIPKLVGCPAEMDAAANELAVNSDELQLLIANAMATNPNLQPCEACQTLLAAASTLQGIDPTQLAAMTQIFDTLAPSDAPFTPEVSASIRTAFAQFQEMETQLATLTPEQYEEYQQYAMTDTVVEAFVSYIAVLNNDLKLPVGDSMALVMTKYIEPLEASNPNLAAYLIEQMQGAGVVTE